MGARSRVPENTDPLLHPFLQAEDESEAQHCLKQLISNHVQPLVREIVLSKLRTTRPAGGEGGPLEEPDDICAEVVVQLLGRLKELRQGPDVNGIASFSGYVATIAHNSCIQTLRQSHPERHRLKNRLRYLLNHDSRFAIWENAQGVRVCGFAGWRTDPGSAEASERLKLEEISEKPNLRQLPPRSLLDALFSLAARPLAVDELVNLTAKIWRIEDSRRVNSDAEEEGEIWSKLPDPRTDVAQFVEQRMYLAALWKEICALRPLQRAALLLNLHDASGQDMLPLFLLTDVARLSEIAASLDMTMPEFHEIWDDLPLDDTTIAQWMQLTRQQVINLRKSARERLARRMSKLW